VDKSERRKAKTAIPPDFAISQRVRDWATSKGFGDLGAHLEHFKRSVAAKGYTYIDWDAAFENAIAADWAKLRQPGRANPVPAAPHSAERIAQDREEAARIKGAAVPMPAEFREALAKFVDKATR
jgi:hypothetical protein